LNLYKHSHDKLFDIDSLREKESTVMIQLNSIIEYMDDFTLFVLRNNRGFDIFKKIKNGGIFLQYIQDQKKIDLEIYLGDIPQQNDDEDFYDSYNIKVSFWNTKNSGCYDICKKFLEKYGWKLKKNSKTLYEINGKCQRGYAVVCIWLLLLIYEFGSAFLDRIDLLKDNVLICSYYSEW
jgi:hypothetical protein